MTQIANIISKKDIETISASTITIFNIKGSDMEAMVQRERIRSIYMDAYKSGTLAMRSGKAGVRVNDLVKQLKSRVNITMNYIKTSDATRAKFTKRLVTIVNYLAFSGKLP